jgi:non-heme chloroperoxidase
VVRGLADLERFARIHSSFTERANGSGNYHPAPEGNAIATSRESHGESSRQDGSAGFITWAGAVNDQVSLFRKQDDLAELFEKLDVKDVTMVGHSTGGREVVRYIGRHGNERVKKVVLIGTIPPVMVKSDKNPGGLPISVFDDIRAVVAGNRAQFSRI